MPTTLYFREGSSDKVYQTDIVPADNGFHVTFAYGRRGATLQTGTKTTSPVPRDEAERIAGKLISSKLAKGYTPAEDGTPYHGTGNEGRDSGIRCQLLNAVDEGDVSRLLKDARHVLQEKHDASACWSARPAGRSKGSTAGASSSRCRSRSLKLP
jgi:bifunctional non-homologous end joining protein LigD